MGKKLNLDFGRGLLIVPIDTLTIKFAAEKRFKRQEEKIRE